MVPFPFRFSCSLFFRKTSCLVVLSLVASFFLCIFVGSIADTLEQKRFRSISLVIPPLSFSHPTKKTLDPSEVSFFSDISVEPLSICREPVVCENGSFSREAITININPFLGSLREDELLIPRSWNELRVGDILSLYSLKDGRKVERKITGFFSDLSGMTNDLVLTEWDSGLGSFACFIPIHRIRSVASHLRERLSPKWRLSTIEDHPIYGGWIQEILNDHLLISCLKMALLYVGGANACFAAILLLSQSRHEIALIQMMGGSCRILLSSFLLWLGKCFFLSFPLALALGFLSIEWGLKRSFLTKRWMKHLPLLQEINTGDFLNDVQLVSLTTSQLFFFIFIVSSVVSISVIIFFRRGPEKIFRDEK
ncbi:hypothetical protein [Candidatus Similichlamydia epinepheli]|uniref:hypothetical protein n=1 Tax=Candidatus Similichlamydia epinepheli TaxID=1903953 RepID=UPI000D38307B|nr:hypothetical protein [Candidatus Similichlamydia epinepheli]